MGIALITYLMIRGQWPTWQQKSPSDLKWSQITSTKHSWRNGTRCRDGLKVLWCHSRLVWPVFEGSSPMCTSYQHHQWLLCSDTCLYCRFCGIRNPSWRELDHFVHFLHLQLQSCERSVFCNVIDLSGLKSFVVKFMIRMSRVRETANFIDVQWQLLIFLLLSGLCHFILKRRSCCWWWWGRS